MLTKQTPNLDRNQQGFASIVIALILIVVLALLTVGFAQLARREQQNALDKQLASQAYYAAESGINDIQQLIQNVYANPAGNPLGIPPTPSLASLTPSSAGLGGNEDPNSCLANQGLIGIPTSSISAPTGVSYTCVLLNLTPPSMVFDGVSPNADQQVTFSTTGALNSLTVYWGSNDGNSTFKPSVGGFTPIGSWGGSPAVIEVSLTPLAQLDRISMINNTFHVYLYPSKTGGSVTYDTTNQGQVIGGVCNSATNSTYPCSVTINGLNGALNEQYLIHVTDYYDMSNISVGNAKDTSGTALDFVDGQAQIDVTGKARTVLKRIEVHANIKDTAPTPPYALQGQNICKRFSTDPINGTQPQAPPGDTSGACDLQ